MPEPRNPGDSGNHDQLVTLNREGLRLRFYTCIASTREAIGVVAERVRDAEGGYGAWPVCGQRA